MPRRKGRLWGWAAQGRQGLTLGRAGLGTWGGKLPIGGKASWGLAAAKGAANARCGLVHGKEQCTLYVCPLAAELCL